MCGDFSIQRSVDLRGTKLKEYISNDSLVAVFVLNVTHGLERICPMLDFRGGEPSCCEVFKYANDGTPAKQEALSTYCLPASVDLVSPFATG